MNVPRSPKEIRPETHETAEQAAATAHPLDGLSAAEQARQLRLIATELEPLP